MILPINWPFSFADAFLRDHRRSRLSQIGLVALLVRFPERSLGAILRVVDDTPLVEDAAFPWLARDTPFGRNCYIFAEGEFLHQRAQ